MTDDAHTNQLEQIFHPLSRRTDELASFPINSSKGEQKEASDVSQRSSMLTPHFSHNTSIINNNYLLILRLATVACDNHSIDSIIHISTQSSRAERASLFIFFLQEVAIDSISTSTICAAVLNDAKLVDERNALRDMSSNLGKSLVLDQTHRSDSNENRCSSAC